MRQGAAPLISVVTPFYNTVDFLPQCIESVLGQGHENWEYVLVDNCSTDGSSEVAAGYAARDDRIRLVRNSEFLSQLANYNRALSLISDESRYTKVVEADNWIYPNCLSEMASLAEAHPRVGVVGAYCITESTLRFLGLPQAVQVMSGRDTARMHFLEDAYLFGAPTTVLLRSEIVRDREAFYDSDTWLVSDLSAIYEILTSWDFGFVHQVLTFVRTQNEGSIQSGRQGFHAMALDRLAVLTRHGREFLSGAEYDAAFRRTQRRYYAHLALGFLQGQGRPFWEFHREGLGEIGARLQRWRLVRQVAVHIARIVANPGSSVMALARRLRRRS